MAKQTIVLYYLLGALSAAAMGFHASTYSVFLLSHGLSFFEINLVNAFFFLTLTTLEIPTGAIADVFGRKMSYVWSCVFLTAGMTLYGFTDSFWGFVLAEVIAGIGVTLASGAFKAWMVDRIRHFGHTGMLAPIFAKQTQLKQVAMMGSALIGAYIYTIDIAFPWLLGGIVQGVTIVIAVIFIKEEYFVRNPNARIFDGRMLVQTIQRSVAAVRVNTAIRFVLTMAFIYGVSIMAMNMQWAPRYETWTGSSTILGWIFIGISLSLIMGARFSERMLRWIPQERMAIIMTLCLTGFAMIGSAVMPLLGLSLSFFFLHEVGRGLMFPIKDAYLHDNIPSRERATIDSMDSMASHCGGMIGLILSGWSADMWSIQTTWMIAGSVLIIGMLTLWKRNGAHPS